MQEDLVHFGPNPDSDPASGEDQGSVFENGPDPEPGYIYGFLEHF